MGKQNPRHKGGGPGEPTDQRIIKEEIRQLAYELYSECGCQQGHDLEHWLEAERLVLRRSKSG